jgi:hypothetical protein
MCSGIQCFATNVLQPTATAIFTQVQEGIAFACAGCEWAGREIDALAHKVLPHWAAVVAETIIKSSPFIALRVLPFPTPLFWAGLASIVVYKIIATPKREEISETTVDNGLAFGGLWAGGNQIAHGITENNFATVLFGITNIATS